MKRTWALPGQALLGWGCLLPVIASAEVSLLSVPVTDLARVYATSFVLLVPLAAILSTATATGIWISGRIADRRGLGWSSAAATLAVTFGAALIIFIAAQPMLLTWLSSLGVDFDPGPLSVLGFTAALVIGAQAAAPVGQFVSNLFSLSRYLCIAGALCSLLAFIPRESGPAPVPVPPPASRPNIVLITLDALSARQMSVYGAPQKTTPNIDALAARGLVFEKAYAASNFTTGGVNSLLTGQYPSQARSLQLLSRPTQEARRGSLPATLKELGYRTGYAVSNPHAGPLRNGYGRYFDFAASDLYRGRPYLCEDRLTRILPFNCFVSNPFIQPYVARLTGFGDQNLEYDPQPVLDAAHAFLATGDKRPIFLWAHFYQPHDPYAAPPLWLGQLDKSAGARLAADSVPAYGFNAKTQPQSRTRLLETRYRESLRWGDAAVGRLLADIARHTTGETIIILTSDHGESFSDGWGGHYGALLNDDVIHIPLIVALPRGPSRRTTIPVSQTDVKAIVQTILGGGDTEGILAMIARRRASEPVFSMSFAEERRLGPLRKGSIAALDGNHRVTRYLGGLATPAGPRQREVLPADAPAEAVVALDQALDQHLVRWGGRSSDQ